MDRRWVLGGTDHVLCRDDRKVHSQPTDSSISLSSSIMASQLNLTRDHLISVMAGRTPTSHLPCLAAGMSPEKTL